MNSRNREEIVKSIAIALLKHLNDKPNQTITYGELARPLGMYERSIAPYLEILLIKCHELGLPLITSIVVLKRVKKPSYGYPREAQELGYSLEQLNGQKDAVFAQRDWAALKRELKLII